MSLVGGLSSAEGNVLVNGRPVCDDYWSQQAASVICRMMGFTMGGQATTNSHFGSVTTDFGRTWCFIVTVLQGVQKKGDLGILTGLRI